MPPRERPPWQQFAAAFSAVALAALLRLALDPLLGDRLPFVTFFLAILALVAYECDWPALVTALMASATVALYLFLAPRHHGVIDRENGAALGAFLISGGIVVLLGSVARNRDRVARAALALADDEANARAAALDELARQEEWFRVALTSIGDAVITTDAAGTITFVNPMAEALTGWPSADAVGRPLAEVFRIVEEATREPATDPVERALATGHVVGLANHTVLIARDGTERPIDDSAAPLRDAPGGRIVGAVLTFHDVATRRHSEQELNDSLALLRGVIDGTPDPIFVKDREGRYRLANRATAEAIGRRPDELIGHTDVELLPAAVAAPLTAVDRRVAESGVGEVATEAVPNARGVRVYQSNKTPWRDAAGRVVGIIGVARDVTEQHRQEEELRAADRRKDEFLAVLAHELRNPLAPLRHNLEILRVSTDPALCEEARSVMGRQVNQLTRLVDDLLDVSRIGRGKVTLRRERMDVAAAARAAVEAVRPALVAAGHELTVELPSLATYVEADPTRLTQVLTNLLQNAIKYSPPGGRIRLSATRDGNEAVLRVRDAGVGIPAEMLERVFEPFAQVGDSLERSQGGLGIGLTLVRSLVELHGGKVAAYSDGPNRGSEFVVRLPLRAEERAEAKDNPGTAAVPAPSTAGRRVVVADDNTDAARSLATLLRLMGHAVREANDGPSALAACVEFDPELVLLDLGMPGMSGYEVARALRGRSSTAGAVLAALTGWGADEDRRRTREAGFDHHLTKPADPEAIRALLAELPRG